MAKVPKLMRYQPPPTVQCPIGTRWLRSTWFLCGGIWEKVEDRVEPALQWERLDKYVERAVWEFHPIQPAAPARKVIQPRQHFGQDESFQLFIQEVDGKDILDAAINSLPARILRCFKTLMRRMHAHHREQDNHRFFVPYRLAVRNHLRPADPNANITFRCVNHTGTVLGLPGYAYAPGLATGTEVTLVALDPNKPTVVMACSESHNLVYRACATLARTGCYDHTSGRPAIPVRGEPRQARHYQIKRHAIFAGHCTGGSSWARLNITRGPATSKLIQDKQLDFWKLFKVFSQLKRHAESKKAAINTN